jgi:hypothetical protein
LPGNTRELVIVTWSVIRTAARNSVCGVHNFYQKMQEGIQFSPPPPLHLFQCKEKVWTCENISPNWMKIEVYTGSSNISSKQSLWGLCPCYQQEQQEIQSSPRPPLCHVREIIPQIPVWITQCWNFLQVSKLNLGSLLTWRLVTWCTDGCSVYVRVYTYSVT